MGISISYEQMIIDAKIIRMTKRTMQGITVSEETLAEEVIKAVGPAGTYLTQMHTREFMRAENFQARLFDRTMYERWVKNGSKDVRMRAKEEARDRLKNHVVPPLDPKVASELKSIISDIEDEAKENKKRG